MSEEQITFRKAGMTGKITFGKAKASRATLMVTESVFHFDAHSADGASAGMWREAVNPPVHQHQFVGARQMVPGVLSVVPFHAAGLKLSGSHALC